MSYEPKNLLGALFKNDKEGNDKRPDYKGDCCINGTEYQIGAWLRVSDKGTKFMSLKFEAKKRQEVSQSVPATHAKGQGQSAPRTQQGGPREYAGEQPGMRGRRELPPDDRFDDPIPF